MKILIRSISAFIFVALLSFSFLNYFSSSDIIESSSSTQSEYLAKKSNNEGTFDDSSLFLCTFNIIPYQEKSLVPPFKSNFYTFNFIHSLLEPPIY